ncbi:Protein of unknown function DUF1635 [Dillenia turbinata]|uniref:Uncharacterized protein n=1 Tax=Dillenia turbinata TaxID=194707 RepID=A0AAN8VB66_9MAGN
MNTPQDGNARLAARFDMGLPLLDSPPPGLTPHLANNLKGIMHSRFIIEELKQKLLLTSYELETTRIEAEEEIRKSKDSVKQLLNLLMIAYQERDEARDQLQKLLNKVIIPTSPNDCCFTMFPIESPLIKPIKANSSITESNSLSSPEFSNIDAVSSPELSNINLGDSNNIGFVTHQTPGQEIVGTTSTRTVDHGTIIIENLVRGKILPQKGRLLQAVMEAGPLLQTLMVAGPLPRWRNPPPLQSFHIPPVGIKGCQTTTTLVDQKPVLNFANLGVPMTNSSFASSQTCSSSMLNFISGDSSSGSGCGNSWQINSVGVQNQQQYQIPSGKRVRLQ